MKTLKRILAGLILAGALVGIPTLALAHGAPAIMVTPTTVAPGGTITVKGETMGANEDFKFSLGGMTFTTELGTATSDANENLVVQFTIPANTPAGDYQIKAVSGDGDATTAELTVTAASNGSASTPSTGNQEPSPAPMNLPRPHSPIEVIGLFAVAVLSVGVGIWLVRST